MRRILLMAALAQGAFALPMQRSSSGEDDDARITLTIYEKALIGDSSSWCEVTLVVTGVDRRLEQDDEVRVRLREDDGIGDDTLWETEFVVTGQEAEAQRVDRTFDCSSDFGDGDQFGGNLEIYATAHIDKQSCGLPLCNDDDPTSDNIIVELADDDDAEDDDDSASAFALPLGITEGRIAKDADWYALSFLDRSQITFRAVHDPRGGRVDVVLFDENGDQVVNGVDQADGSLVQTAPLPPGEYTVRAQPRDGTDYNFYDVELRIVVAGCEQGSVEVQPCGNCGQRRRVCGDDGAWMDWGDCMGAGECAPGDERTEVCGLCGRELQICNDECAWGRGECVDEGVCVAGARESEACAGGGVRSRTCSEACEWDDFGECDDAECADGESEDCYGGPDGTDGVGVCSGGTRTCASGAWGACEGETRPSPEDCADGDDNDCDGDTDDSDDDCGAVGDIGAACRNDMECAEGFQCLQHPSNLGFRGGYCGIEGCDGSCPGDAICGSAFGERYCLAPCDRDSECRPDYRCVAVDGADRACVPACQRDADCRDPALPVCDRMTGVCGTDDNPTPDPDMGGNPPPRRDMGNNPPPLVDQGVPNNGTPDMGVSARIDGGTGGAASSDDGCGCDTRGEGPSSLWWVLMLPLLAVRRRR